MSGTGPIGPSWPNWVAAVRISGPTWWHQRRGGGGYCAIQCKLYADNSKLTKASIDSFLADTDDSDLFTSRILVSNVEPNRHAGATLAQAKPVPLILGPDDLDSLAIDWLNDFRPVVVARKKPYPHQKQALADIKARFRDHDRGQLIMACGTGKTLVALWTVEQLPAGSTILYLVPSLQLMRQTLKDWQANQNHHHRYVSVCSDKAVDRSDQIESWEKLRLPIPVTTDVGTVVRQLDAPPPDDSIRIIMSTYQSLPVISRALLKCRIFEQFDLIIADEAHHTTGLSDIDPADVGAFQLVHDNSQIPATKRLYMTATQRVYKDKFKSRAADINQDCYSMDDPVKYGPVFHMLSFGQAVDQKLLSDYQILVIEASHDIYQAIKEDIMAIIDQVEPKSRQQMVDFETAVSLLGCWDALADPQTEKISTDRIVGQLPADKTKHIKSAIAFTQKISKSKKISSDDNHPGLWKAVNQAVRDSLTGIDGFSQDPTLHLNLDHIDGTMSSYERDRILNNLKDTKTGQCQIVSNARVLREGVDVPNLDAVIFLDSRKSAVDIVQAVGRVMRKDPNNPDKIGYVIVPVVVPPGQRITDDSVIDGDNFATVWQVIRGLKSHDERAMAWTSDARLINPVKVMPTSQSLHPGPEVDSVGVETGQQLRFWKLGLDQAYKIASRMVDQCGDKKMWPTWGQKAAKVCRLVEKSVRDGLEADESRRAKLDQLVGSLKRTISNNLTDDQVIEMVSQHIITKPVFDRIFAGTRATDNPIAKDLDHFVSIFPVGQFEGVISQLDRAYQSMGQLLQTSTSLKEKVDIVRQIYDGFFKHAIPDSVRQLGIVYTPTGIVDNMIRLTEEICQKKLNFSLSDRGINILEPFAGTGTFIYRLLTYRFQNGDYLIKDRDLKRKFQSEIHGSEIVLLAYYIASVNISSAIEVRNERLDDLFGGMVLANTFKDFVDPDQQSLPGVAGWGNQFRLSRQKNLPIQVIIGNPPWSAGKKSAADKYDLELDYDEIAKRVSDTYGQSKLAKSAKAARNLYIRAIRWASDRLFQSDQPGIIAFVHPNSLSKATSGAGVRDVLEQEFSDIYFVDLLGDAMTSKEEFRRQGDKLFGAGSRNGVQLTFLVYDPAKKPSGQKADVHSATVAEYQNLQQKLDWLAGLELSDFQLVPRNPHSHWVDVTDDSYFAMMPVVAKNQDSIFRVSGKGIITSMDDYVYNWSRLELINRVQSLFGAYNTALERVSSGLSPDQAQQETSLPDVIKWNDKLKKLLVQGVRLEFDESKIIRVLYRPFIEKWLYADSRILASASLLKLMPPTPNIGIKNPSSSRGNFSVPLASGSVIDLNYHTDGGGQPSQGDQSDNVATPGQSVRSLSDSKPSGRHSHYLRQHANSGNQAIVFRNPMANRGQSSNPLASSGVFDSSLQFDGGGGLFRWRS